LGYNCIADNTGRVYLFSCCCLEYLQNHLKFRENSNL